MTASVAFAAPPKDSVAVLNSKYKNLFVFKAAKKLMGASVEVFSSEGILVTKQTLEKRKMIIDFCDVKKGDYLIRIAKGNKKKEYSFSKKI